MTIARVEIGDQNSQDFIADYQIKRIPYIVIFKDGEAYFYHDLMDYAGIMRFINRIHKHMEKLPTMESMEKFLNRSETDYDNNHIPTVKVVGMFFDPEETEEDIKDFYRAAYRLLDRNEVYFGMVTF